ncbi:hypothetical protein Salat_1077300 [Sesamum alatum]|uniref:Uncharacterized protein n=1 Tax=Sesamum alatum TaxID=300844 RepID=A0AAE1YMW3_9LAMI|nr:hypothetical protein Salat_1077300 [Sesamum alatum]
MESGEDRKRKSFGLSLADEKIKLIDMLSEDDHFLVASPFCTDSLTDGTREEHGGFGHSQTMIPCHEFVQPSRPSFLRRSLAWDAAFFNSADELSFINQGYRTSIDVRKRRSESGPTSPTGGGLSLDWFDIEPSIHDDSTRSSAVLKKVDNSSRNEVMSDRAYARKSIYVRSEEKIKKECQSMIKDPLQLISLINEPETTSSSRRPGRVLSMPKPPNVLGRKTTNLPTKSNRKDVLLGKSTVKIDNNSASLPHPEFSSLVSPTSPIVSTASVPLLGTWKLSSSVSASKIWRHTGRSKGIGFGHLSLSTNRLSCRPPGSSTSPSPSHSRPSGLRPPSPQIRFFDENTPPRYDGATRSRKIPRIVVPEGTSHIGNSRVGLLTGEVLHESRIGSGHACKKLTSPLSGTGKNIKRSKIDYTSSFLETRSTVDDGGKRPGNKQGPNSFQEENKRRDKLKNKGRRGSPGHNEEVISSDQENGKKNMSCSSDQLGNLSKYFKYAIDLNQKNSYPNQEKSQELNKKQARFRSAHKNNDGMRAYSLIKKENQKLESPQSGKDAAWVSGTRAPLADKTSACNLSEELAFSREAKKERSVSASAAGVTLEKENK